MSVTCCPLSSGDDEMNTLWKATTRRARTPHQCCECRDEIPAGATYEVARGLYDGSWSSWKTCLSCVEIRTHFACDGFFHECLWEDLEGNFYPGMRAGGPCLAGLSPEAKARLFERRTAWLLGSPMNQARVDAAQREMAADEQTRRARGEPVHEFDPRAGGRADEDGA